MEQEQQDLDESQLAELREDLGDAFAGFVDGFREMARGLPAEIDADLARGALADAAARAHKLKGTAGYLGAVKVADSLARLQRAAETGDLEESRSLVTVLEGNLAALEPRLAAFTSSG